jgi:hypothetical protein
MSHHRELLQAFAADLDGGLGVVVSPLQAIELRNALRAALVMTDEERDVVENALAEYADTISGIVREDDYDIAVDLLERLTERKLP